MGREVYRPPLREGAVCRFEIFQQNTPGNAVDGEVVCGQHQAAGLTFPKGEVDSADQRPLRDVEFGLLGGGDAFDVRALRISDDGRQVVADAVDLLAPSFAKRSRNAS